MPEIAANLSVWAAHVIAAIMTIATRAYRERAFGDRVFRARAFGERAFGTWLGLSLLGLSQISISQTLGAVPAVHASVARRLPGEDRSVTLSPLSLLLSILRHRGPPVVTTAL